MEDGKHTQLELASIGTERSRVETFNSGLISASCSVLLWRRAPQERLRSRRAGRFTWQASDPLQGFRV